MSADFIKRDLAGFSLWQYNPWIERGWIHGFTGSELNFDSLRRNDSIQALNRALKLNSAKFLQQTHGNVVINYQPDSSSLLSQVIGEGDAVIGNHEGVALNLAIGVLTADCLPLLVRSDNSFMAVHAGWRGLSNGIIEKSFGLIKDYSSIEVLIGPAAGFNDYQVGSEVVKEIPLAVSKEQNGSLYLNLQQTALNQIKEISPEIKVIALERSTISDLGFHSYRRDGALAGRNYSFLVI